MQPVESHLCLYRYRAKPAMIMAIKGTRMAAATELLLDAKLYPWLSLKESKLSVGKRHKSPGLVPETTKKLKLISPNYLFIY